MTMTMNDSKRMDSLELSPINQENNEELETICQLIEEFIQKYSCKLKAFAAMDVSGEGGIGMHEFTQQLQNTFSIDDENKIQHIFEQFDLDNDGIISLDDWVLAFEQYPLKLVRIQQNSVSQNSDLNHIVAQHAEHTAFDHAGHIAFDHAEHTAFRPAESRTDSPLHENLLDSHGSERREEQLSEKRSTGFEGLVRICNNVIKTHQLNTQTALSFEHSQERRSQCFLMRSSNIVQVDDEKVQSIFGEDFRTPNKDTSKQINLDSEVSEQPEHIQPPTNEYQSVLSQKIVSPLQNWNQTHSEQVTRLPRNMQSSSPHDQGKTSPLQTIGHGNFAAPFKNLMRNVKLQQPDNPQKNMKDNFQNYLSYIGLGSSRASAFSNINPAVGANQPSSYVSPLYRVSSTERQSLFSKSALESPKKSATSKNRAGLEGIIDQINIKKDYLAKKRADPTDSTQQQFNKQFPNNNSSIKFHTSHPLSQHTSKQSDIEGSLEKFRLISSMQRGMNYAPTYPKENESQLRLSSFSLLKQNGQNSNSLRSPPSQMSSFIPSVVSWTAPKSTFRGKINFTRAQSPSQVSSTISSTLPSITNNLKQSGPQTKGDFSSPERKNRDRLSYEPPQQVVSNQPEICVSQEVQSILTPDAFEDYIEQPSPSKEQDPQKNHES